MEEQHHRLKEARLNLTTPLTSEVKASEPENYSGSRPKTTSRANLTSVTPSVLPLEAVAKTYSSHSKSRQEQQSEDYATLLRDEIFSVIPGSMNMQCGTAQKIGKLKVAVISVVMRSSIYLKCQTHP